MKTVFLFLLSAIQLTSAIYNIKDFSLDNRMHLLRLNISDSLEGTTLRGILIWGNGAGSNNTDRATRENLSL